MFEQDSNSLQWLRAGLLLAVAWVLGVMTAGFLLNRFIVIARTYDALDARGRIVKALSKDIRDSIGAQREAGGRPSLFLSAESNAAASIAHLRVLLPAQDGAAMDAFIALHREFGQRYRTAWGGELSSSRAAPVAVAQQLEMESVLNAIEGRWSDSAVRQRFELSRGLRVFGAGVALSIGAVVGLFFLIGRTLAMIRRDVDATSLVSGGIAA